MRIGILGGTFDPVHSGHLILAETAYNKFNLDKVIFIPAGKPYFKGAGSVSCGSWRAEMVKLAVKDNSHFDFSDIELTREGNTYTVDTLKKLKDIYSGAELFFIIGSDILYQLENWKDAGEIFKLTDFIVASRNAVSGDVQNKICELEDMSGRKFIHKLKMANIDISSTDIRNMVKEGVSVRYLTTDEVIDFIEKKGLYK